jgi:hypothetical protein
MLRLTRAEKAFNSRSEERILPFPGPFGFLLVRAETASPEACVTRVMLNLRANTERSRGTGPEKETEYGSCESVDERAGFAGINGNL